MESLGYEFTQVLYDNLTDLYTKTGQELMQQCPDYLESKEFTPKKLVWTEPAAPNDSIRYDHIIAETPFGRFLITWKSWKPYHYYCVDEAPWGEGIYSLGIYSEGNSLEDAKAACELQWKIHLKDCMS